MRYPKNRKEQSRQRIVEAAVRAFNEHGVDGIGIADIMKRAGLTQGAFSRHFTSKEELLREALDEGFCQTPFMPPDQTEAPLDKLVRLYLSTGHRDDVKMACLAGTLTAEMVRHPLRTRKIFIDHLKKNFATIVSKLPRKGSGADRKKEAMSVFALLVGTLQIARVTKDTDLSDKMLEAGIEAAKKLISK